MSLSNVLLNRLTIFKIESGYRDSNPGPPTPEAGALTGLRYIPSYSAYQYMSGYQDSNLGPPAPKAGALTGLRYIPKNFDAQRYAIFFNTPNIFASFFSTQP